MIAIESFNHQFFLSLTNELTIDLSKEKLEYTGPTYRKRENNTTVSYNIYPVKDKFESVWNLLDTLLKLRFKDLSKSGEVINYTSEQGSIKDQGIEYFKVFKALLFECYIYEPESFIYCRLLHEFDVLKAKEWISIDFDGIERSAWFEE